MTGDCNELLEKRIREYVPDFDSELYRNILSNFSWKWQENIPTGVLHMAMHTGSKTVVEKYLHFMDDYSDEPGAGWGLLSSVGDVAVYAEPETTERSIDLLARRRKEQLATDRISKALGAVANLLQTDEAINKYMAAVPEDDLDVIAVTECINQVTKSKNKLTTKSLLQFFTGYSCRFTAGAIGVIAEGTPEALKPVIWCLREHRDNQNVCQALAYVFELTYTLGKELVINSANFMRKIPSQVVYPIAKSIQRMFFSRDKFTKLMISEYLFICKTLPGMEKYVYKEFGDWIVRRYDESIADTVKKNDGFLRGQKSENVFPLTMILNGLDGEYHDSIRQLDENCKGRLAKAFSIARDNVDDETKENYLPNFYTGLKECLEERPDDLGKWAASICSEFRKQGEQGLLRGVVG